MDAADAVEQVVAVDGQLIAQVAEYLVGSAHRLEVEAVGVVALHDILALALEAALLQRHPERGRVVPLRGHHLLAVLVELRLAVLVLHFLLGQLDLAVEQFQTFQDILGSRRLQLLEVVLDDARQPIEVRARDAVLRVVAADHAAVFNLRRHQRACGEFLTLVDDRILVRLQYLCRAILVFLPREERRDVPAYLAASVDHLVRLVEFQQFAVHSFVLDSFVYHRQCLQFCPLLSAVLIGSAAIFACKDTSFF